MDEKIVDHKFEVLPLAKLIVDIGGEKSMSDARRTIAGGGVTVNSQVVTLHTATVKAVDGLRIQVGRRKVFILREI